MSGSVEASKDAAKEGVKAPVKEASKAAPRSKAAARELLKQAVGGTDEIKNAAPAPAAAPQRTRLPRESARYAAVATVALVVGTALGMIAAPKPRSAESLAQIEVGLESGRAEASRLNGEVERLGKSLAGLRDASELARSDGRQLAASLTERAGKLEQTLDGKLAGLGGTIERMERDQAARIAGLAAQIEKRTAQSQAAIAPAAAAQPAAKPEPTQTGSIADAKPKSDTVETWALRDVYGGVAILEDRKRRLVEVGPGDAVPGVGRVESIERRGRVWVVVTKQGLIAPQTW